MAALIPLFVWLISAAVCHSIAHVRNVERTFMRRLLVVILGPLAIPFALLAKPISSADNHEV